MALLFDNEITLAAGEMPFLGHEMNNDLVQYTRNILSRMECDQDAQPLNGYYTSLEWGGVQHRLSVRGVARIGVKNFPHIGAYGFYKDLYSGQSYVLIPIHKGVAQFDPPVLSVTPNDTVLDITVTPPADVTYTCYKVVLRNNFFAYEYVIYDRITQIPAPAVIGDYIIYAIGYNEDEGICSSDSNIVYYTQTTGQPTWEPLPLQVPMSLGQLTDVTLVNLLNEQSLKYNNITGKWENADTGDLLTVTLLSENWLGDATPWTQIVALTGIVATGFSYVVTPDEASWYAYGASGIIMNEPTEDGIVSFTALTSKPLIALTVNILKVRAS